MAKGGLIATLKALRAWITFALFDRNEKPAAPAFVIFEGWVFVLMIAGDLDG